MLLQKDLTKILVPSESCLPSSPSFLLQLHLCNSSWVTSGRWREESHFQPLLSASQGPSLSSLYFTGEKREEGGGQASPRDESIKYFSNFHLQRLVSFNSRGEGESLCFAAWASNIISSYLDAKISITGSFG